MDKEYIKKLAENPRFIPGIYNYCDRWCERCHLTSRCMNFALGEEQFDDPQVRDINNKVFWQKLSEIFQITFEMLKETAQEQGIDLDCLDIQQAAEEYQKTRAITKNHKCSRMAKTYSQMVNKFFESAKHSFAAKADDLNMEARLELPNSNPSGEATELNDLVDVIRWYQHQIYVKLARAIGGALEEMPDDILKDSDCSAKVALIAIDRSMTAWGRMYEHFPQHKADILDILLLLDRLRTKMQSSFPNARAFVRPGFDDENQDG